MIKKLKEEERDSEAELGNVKVRMNEEKNLEKTKILKLLFHEVEK